MSVNILLTFDESVAYAREIQGDPASLTYKLRKRDNARNYISAYKPKPLQALTEVLDAIAEFEAVTVKHGLAQGNSGAWYEVRDAVKRPNKLELEVSSYRCVIDMTGEPVTSHSWVCSSSGLYTQGDVIPLGDDDA